MKRIISLGILVCGALSVMAQTDSTKKETPDTIRVGGITIIKKPGKGNTIQHDREYKIFSRNRASNSKISTNWWILDLGWSNYTDNTLYSSAAAQAYAPGANSSWLKIKNGQSRNVNLWFFMQKLNVSKHVLNLKYGLGLEMNNYFYKQPIRYDANPPAIATPAIISYDVTAGRNYKKNKLAADYLTIPVMLNVNFTPRRNNGFGFSGGLSVGYLYSSRNKTVTSDEGKRRSKDDFDLEKWKLSYVGEISLGPVRFYGSYAMKNMYSRGLDITPYNFGFRLSNW